VAQWFGGSAAQRRLRLRRQRRLQRFVGGKPSSAAAPKINKKNSQIEWRSLDWRSKCVTNRT